MHCIIKQTQETLKSHVGTTLKGALVSRRATPAPNTSIVFPTAGDGLMTFPYAHW